MMREQNASHSAGNLKVHLQKAKLPQKFRKQSQRLVYLIFYKIFVIIFIEIKGKTNPLIG